jgi:type II secretory pathway component GspD/PulD (secretin)
MRVASLLLLFFVWAGQGALDGGLGPAARADSEHTDVFRLSHMRAARAGVLYRRFVGLGLSGKIVSQDDENILVIRDERSKLMRFRAILSALDKKGASSLKIFLRPVRFAKPATLANQLREILADRFRHPLRLVPDPAGSRLLVMTSEAQYAVLHRLAKRLDVPERSNGE